MKYVMLKAVGKKKVSGLGTKKGTLSKPGAKKVSNSSRKKGVKIMDTEALIKSWINRLESAVEDAVEPIHKDMISEAERAGMAIPRFRGGKGGKTGFIKVVALRETPTKYKIVVNVNVIGD